MKSEVKNIVHKAALLETSQSDGIAKMDAMEKDLSEARLLVGKTKEGICSVFSKPIAD